MKAPMYETVPAAEPTLAETCAVLKRELELSGNVTEVVSSACRVLGVDDTGTLVARAKKCRELLGEGTGGEIAAGAALAGTVIEGTVVGVGAVAPVAAQPPMARKLQPADRWGRRVCGPKIDISADGLTVTDVARNPKTGDGTAGRYRPVLSEGGVASGQHTWDVKIASPGRLCVGVATDEVKSDWHEGFGRRAIFQTSEAWTVCVPSRYGSGNYDQIRMRHGRGEGWLSGLPTYAEGDVLGVHLDCEKHTLSFTVNGKPGTRSTYKNLPAKRFYLAAAFGGDGVAGASLTLLSQSPSCPLPSSRWPESSSRRGSGDGPGAPV